jgi:hypothetical protein
VEIDNLPLEYEQFHAAVMRAYLIRLLTATMGEQCAAARKANVHRNTVARWAEQVGLTKAQLRRIRRDAYRKKNGALPNV